MALALPFSAAIAAESQPSSKVTAKTSAIHVLPDVEVTSPWTTVLENQIKTSSKKDLFVGVSFEVGLYTQTLSMSKGMQKDTSTADGIVKVRVLVDDKIIEPGAVVFGRRAQTLSATLEGAIASCLSIVDGAVVLDEECVTPEAIELILETMDAASFNFVGVDIPQGVHTVKVQAQVELLGSAQQGSYKATATVGKGSMTVESVRLIKDEDVVVPEVL